MSPLLSLIQRTLLLAVAVTSAASAQAQNSRRLSNSQPGLEEHGFGSSVSLDGDLLLVGAPFDNLTSIAIASAILLSVAGALAGASLSQDPASGLIDVGSVVHFYESWTLFKGDFE